jgi:hypothetical protein
MNQDQILGAVRWIATLVCGILVGRGLITSEQVPSIVAACLSLAPLIWSIFLKTNKAKVASAQAIPQAQVLVSDPALASEGVQVASPSATTVSVMVPKP